MKLIQDVVAQNALSWFLIDNCSKYRRDIVEAQRDAVRLERASIDEITSVQEKKLRHLLQRVRESPYYQGVMAKSDIDPHGFRIEELPLLPFLTKETLQSKGTELVVPGARGCRNNYSGGSTGKPAAFRQDYDYWVQSMAAMQYENGLAGMFRGARLALLWGAPQDRREIEGVQGRIRLWLLNRRYYDSFDMGPDSMAEFHADLEKWKPDVIQSYASSIYLLANFLSDRGIRPSYPRISVITSAERLRADMRRKIEEVFRVAVFDRYGSREVSSLAAECECHQGLHVFMPGYIIETVDVRTGRPVVEEIGEIVVTSLHNFAMPFVRYRIGDLGVLTRTRCECGRRFYRLQEIVGRISDSIVLRNGRIIHGECFTHLVYGVPGIARFQFIQENLDEFVLRLVPSPGFDRRIIARLEHEIRQIVGEARIGVDVVEEIPVSASGKYRFTISKVAHPLFGDAVGRGDEPQNG